MMPETPEGLYVTLRRDIREVVRTIQARGEVPEALQNLLGTSMQEEVHRRTGLNGELDPGDLDELLVGFLEFWETRSGVKLPPNIFDQLCSERATFRDMLIAFQRLARASK